MSGGGWGGVGMETGPWVVRSNIPRSVRLWTPRLLIFRIEKYSINF
jgi:hypothetical protein